MTEITLTPVQLANLVRSLRMQFLREYLQRTAERRAAYVAKQKGTA